MSRLAIGKRSSLFCRSVSDEEIKRITTFTKAFNFCFEIMVVLLVTHIMLGKACQDGQVLPPPPTLNKLGPRGSITPLPPPPQL